MHRPKVAREHLHGQPILHADQMVAEDGLPISGMHVYVVRMACIMPVMVVTCMIMSVMRAVHCSRRSVYANWTKVSQCIVNVKDNNRKRLDSDLIVGGMSRYNLRRERKKM